MRNIKVIMSYKGTAYHGFQRQENAIAIQNIVEDTLTEMLKDEVKINGCSRTDTGVHANKFCFNFLTECMIPNDNLLRAANRLLPRDIVFLSCEDINEEFHARFDCIGKEYVYMIDNSRIRNVFTSDTALHYPYPINVQKLNEAAKHFVGTKDFTSLCGTANLKENCIRTVEYCNVYKNENMVKIVVKGDGFLYNMVRIIVGTLIYVSENKISADDIPKIIAKKNRIYAGKTAEPQGLFLNEVFYS